MRVVIDLQGAQSESRTRGIGRYCLGLAHAIARKRASHDVVIILNDAFPESIEQIQRSFFGVLPRDKFHVWQAPGPTNFLDSANDRRRQRAEILYKNFVANLNPDLLHIASTMEGYSDDAVSSVTSNQVNFLRSVTLYDFIPLHDPALFLEPNPRWSNFYYRKLEDLKQADLLLAISKFSSSDAEKYLQQPNQLVVNIAAGCSDVFRPLDVPNNNLLSRLGISRPFILTSGTIEPHKNLMGLFQAFSLLPEDVRRGHAIVLMGNVLGTQRPILRSMATDAGLSANDLVITGYVTDQQLVELYNLCKLMVFPSKDEGFGLPALEAMTCGAPTIASRATSLPEVIGLDEALFDPCDAADIAKLLQRGLCDTSFRNDLSLHAINQSKKYSWDATGQKALRAMEVAYAKRDRHVYPQTNCVSTCIDELAKVGADRLEIPSIARALACNFPELDRPRQLLVDVSELVEKDARTGCQRVTRSVVLEWLRNPPSGVNVQLVYATLEAPGYRYARSFAAKMLGLPAEGSDDPVDYAAGDVFFGLDLQLQIVPAQAEFLAKMKRRGVDVRFLVYDILPVELTDYFPVGTEPAFRLWLQTISRFNGIIGISRSTTEAFKSWQQKANIDVAPDFTYGSVHLGADIESSAPSMGLLQNAGDFLSRLAARKTFLSVGTVEPRKGYSQILAAFELLWERGADINLAIVGKTGWGQGALVEKLRQHPENAKRLFWFEEISDEYLQKIYEVSVCLVSASEGEGFGLPLIEAARQNLPLLVRDIPVFREVAGSYATYFSGLTSKDLADAVSRWIRKSRSEIIPQSKEMPWITWSESAKQMASVLLANSGSKSGGGVASFAIKEILGFEPQYKKILIVKLDHLGDILLALPAISFLRARYPKATFDIVVGSWSVDLVRRLGIFSNIFVFDFFDKKSSVAPDWRGSQLQDLLSKLGKYDIAIDLRRQPDSRFVLVGVNAVLKVGYETGSSEVDSHLGIALKHWQDIPGRATPLNEAHISEQMLLLARSVPMDKNDFLVMPPVTEIGTVAAKKTAVALFPRAGSSVKEWGDENYLSLAHALAEGDLVDEINCYFTTQQEVDSSGFRPDDKIKIHCALPFNSLCKSLQQNAICVANNSFGSHIASYLGVTVVGIYGGHETAEEWSPIFGKNFVIKNHTHCSPCHIDDRASCKEDMRCLSIPVSFVYESVLSVLKDGSVQRVERL